jgi:hypothetical protein
MLVPKFWAEARVQERTARKQVTVRRFGWSDESQAEAQAMADGRAREALTNILSGQKIDRRELKRAYNGSEGVPIREEIVASYGETVLTRNSYGAVCLNTPNVLFADIDFSEWPSARLALFVLGAFICGAVALGWTLHLGLGCAALMFALLIFYPIASRLHRWWILLSGGDEQLVRRRIDKFLNAHSDWHVRLYRTPAGLRVLAMHQTFNPSDTEVAECFRTLGTDPIYVRMCLRQQCFRARVSPKPWRIGISRHLRPTGVWPIDPSRLPERRQWIENYEQAATNYASCRFIEGLGSGVIHPEVSDVQQIHDELCQANRALPIA